MSIVFPNDAEVLLLKYMLNHTSATDTKMHLYTSNITPAESDVIGDYTPNEASDGSYTPASLTGASWTFSSVGGTTTASYAQQSFSFSSSANVYGYYVTDNSDTNLLWAERFNVAPFQIPSEGGEIAITPELELE